MPDGSNGPGRVLVTGGTRGIGLAIALELTRHGATVCVTHAWGSVLEKDLQATFLQQGLKPPRMERCDVSDPHQTKVLVSLLYEEWGGIDAIVSNVAFGASVTDLNDLSRSSLEIAMGYTTWPLLDLVQLCLKRDIPPRRFIAISSPGVDCVFLGYDMIAVSKAALETLVRYLAPRLRPSGIVINAIRLGYVDTESLRTIVPQLAETVRSNFQFMDPVVAARSVVALLGGLMDGMTGQVITVDEGYSVTAEK